MQLTVELNYGSVKIPEETKYQKEKGHTTCKVVNHFVVEKASV